MTIISQSVTDIAGATDTTRFVFYRDEPLTLSAQGQSILTWTDVPVVPSNGVLTTPDLAPGPAKVKWGGQAYDIVIPDAAQPVKLWPLIRDYQPQPAPVVAEVAAIARETELVRDGAIEAAGISVAAAEFSDRRATDADESAIEAAFSAAEASATVAAQLATKADKNHTHDNKANLGPDGKLLQAEMPAQQMVDFLGVVGSQAAMLALTGQRGDWCTRTDLGTDWQLVAEPSTALSSWRQHTYPASPVSSVFGRTGAVTGSRADVGLGNVDNTKDIDKPVSTPQQAALNAQRDAINLELLGKAAKHVDRGNWVASTSYAVGDVVTASYARWYCKTAHSSGSTFSQTNWMSMGLAAIAASTDPGIAGWLWVKV